MSLVQHTCVDCQTKSPQTDSNYSLIGLAGWRLATSERPNEWRCPRCWALHKRRANAVTYRALPRIEDIFRDRAPPSGVPSSRRRG